MKHNYLKHLFTALLMLCATTVAAHDFWVGGIYYNILSETDKTVEVTYYEAYLEGVGEIYDPYRQSRIVIPKDVTYNDVTYSVTSIGDRTFYKCTGLTSITIPSSVTSIGERAFYDCSGLKEVHIGDLAAWCGIEFDSYYGIPLYYGGNLYLNGELVTDLVIPNNVTNIRDYAFYGCTGLTSITIPNSVTSIGYDAFENCIGLKTVINFSNLTFSKGSEDYGSVACYADKVYNAPNGSFEGDFIFGKPNDVNTLVDYLGNATEITLPDNYNGENYTIGNSAFSYCDRLKSITIPNSVTSIGSSAFRGCTGLTSITIPNSVTSIGEGVFYGCSGLTSITIPNSVTSIGGSAFSGCRGLTGIVIPNSVTSIGDYAFYSCSGLTSITIPDSVTSIGNAAFAYCTGLISIVIPNSVTSIGGSAFYGCTGLTSITIPNSVTSIEDYAFKGCTSLKELRIEDGESTLSLGYNKSSYSYSDSNGLFYDCPLETLYLGRNLSYDISYSWGYSPFYNIETLANVTIGKNVTSIGGQAFTHCTCLTGIEIPNSVTSIGRSAFSGCTGLKTVYNFSNLTFSKGSSSNGYVAYYADKVYNVPNGFIDGDFIWSENEDGMTLAGYLGNDTELTLPAGYNGENYAIGAAAFQNYTGLAAELIIHNNITGIGASAFKGCNNIEKLYIGSSVESIGDKAFAGCEKITEIKVALEKPIRGSADIFTDAVYDNATLYIPNGTEQLYQKREPWNIFFYIVEMDFTGIDEVFNEVKGENGKVQTIYDLQGRKVEVPSEGLYIINGKKVMIK